MNSIIKLGIGLPAYGAKISMWHAQMWLTLGAALAQSSKRFELRMIGYVDACGVDVAVGFSNVADIISLP